MCVGCEVWGGCMCVRCGGGCMCVGWVHVCGVWGWHMCAGCGVGACTSRLRWPARTSHGSMCLCFPSTGLQACIPHVDFFSGL